MNKFHLSQRKLCRTKIPINRLEELKNSKELAINEVDTLHSTVQHISSNGIHFCSLLERQIST